MLHSRLLSPKSNNLRKSSIATNPINRSKSSASFVQMVSKMEIFSKNSNNTNTKQEVKVSIRAQSAFKKNNDDNKNVGLPKVNSLKGKLCLGKMIKPGMILSTEARHNPWADPNPINEAIINRKGLMEMINMGMLPKNSDFTELLNHRYEPKQKQKQLQEQVPIKQENNGFFTTNLNIVQLRQNGNTIAEKQSGSDKKQKPQSRQVRQSVTQQSDKKFRKKSKKKSKKQALLYFPQQPVVLQISNQKVQKNEKYNEQLKKLRKTGDQTIFKLYIKKVEQFALKYGLKKFQFRVIVNEIKKITDYVIYQNILNARALGIHVAVKGALKKRINDIVRMFTTRYKFKKSRKDLLKIQKIKRYYKIKKQYELMTKRRCDLLKFRLGSFAQRQRRFIEEATQKSGVNQKFRVHIHMICKSGKTYEQQQSYYKLQHRNNIQLTRIFNSEPEYLIILMPQQVNLSPWLNLLKKLKSYHATIQPIFTSLKDYRIRTHDSIYYGIDKNVVSRVKKICGKSESVCLFNGDFSNALIDICQTFNAKLYGSSFWKPHLDKLLQQEDEEQQKEKEKQLMMSLTDRQKNNQQQEQVKRKIRLSQSYSSQKINNLMANSSGLFQINSNSQSMRQVPKTQAQVKHMFQKMRRKQLRSYQLNGQHFSNKLTIKTQIFLQFGCQTPQGVTFEANTPQKQMLRKLTQTILQHKTVNKWVFKLANLSRWSRGLAFLQTDSLKILKEKKKKNQISQSDIVEVSNIMKVILVDKLQIPQNSLMDAKEYLQQFLQIGGYVEICITDYTSQCIFGKISAVGQFTFLGTYTKIYTDQMVNCAGTYPSSSITQKNVSIARQLAQKLYKKYELFGYVTFELLIQKKSKKYYFIDLCLSLNQYSSFYFMYKAILNNLKPQQPQQLKILRKVSQKKGTIAISNQTKKQVLKNSLILSELNKLKNGDNSQKDSLDSDKGRQEQIGLARHIIYIPFIDNNGNTLNTFQQFQQACVTKSIKMLDFEQAEGLQFLYLNLNEQRPDVLSLVAFSDNQKKMFKYTLDGLNFLAESGERTNKFDKKVQRRKYDCLYIHDIIWKLRQLKKSKDTVLPIQFST